MTTFNYAPYNRPAQECAPAGFVVVSADKTEFTPYGVIGYTAPLDAMACWKYELRDLNTKLVVGSKVQYVLRGKLYTGEITSIEGDTAYVDDAEKLPSWRLTVLHSDVKNSAEQRVLNAVKNGHRIAFSVALAADLQPHQAVAVLKRLVSLGVVHRQTCSDFLGTWGEYHEA